MKTKDTPPKAATPRRHTRKADNPKTIKAVARSKALGNTNAQAARDAGVNDKVVTELVNREDIKQLIAEQTNRLVSLLPDAVDLVADTMNESKEQGLVASYDTGILGKDGKTIMAYDDKRHKNLIGLRKLALNDGAKDVLKAAGLLPTQAAAPTVQTLIIAGDQAALSPILAQIVGGFLSKMDGNTPQTDSIRDVTPSDDDPQP